MSSDFLRAVADNIVGLTGLRDHDWSSNNQTARLFDAEVVTDDTLKISWVSLCNMYSVRLTL